MEKHTAYYELLKQLAQADCPVCALAARRTHSFLERYLDEGVVNEESWDRLVAAGAWCARHARELESFDDGLALSIFYGFLFKKKAEALAQGKALQAFTPGVALEPGPLGRLSGAPRQGCCPACEIEHETERTQAHLLAQALAEAEVQAVLERHPGLCLAHVDLVLQRCSTALKDGFIRQQSAKLGNLAAELELFVRRSEHGATEPLGAERDAWKRALRRYYGPALGEL
jgi:hypothetical protein